MKKFIRIGLSLLILFSFFSCRNSFDLVKRRYMSGFYVEHSHGRSTEKIKGPAKEKESASPFIREKQQAQAENCNVTQKEEIVYNDEVTVGEKGNLEKPGSVATDKIKPGMDDEKESKESKSIVKKIKREHSEDLPVGGAIDDTVKLLLMILLALIVPPLACYIKQDGITKWFWITLILWLLGGGLLTSAAYYGGLWFAAFIIALLVVLDVIS